MLTFDIKEEKKLDTQQGTGKKRERGRVREREKERERERETMRMNAKGFDEDYCLAFSHPVQIG